LAEFSDDVTCWSVFTHEVVVTTALLEIATNFCRLRPDHLSEMASAVIEASIAVVVGVLSIAEALIIPHLHTLCCAQRGTVGKIFTIRSTGMLHNTATGVACGVISNILVPGHRTGVVKSTEIVMSREDIVLQVTIVGWGRGNAA